MTSNGPLRIGLMGFGRTGRQLFDLSAACDDLEIVAIADIGRADLLLYLLRSEVREPERYTLDGNFLCGPRSRARLMSTDTPAEMPWDIFDVDLVIDATGVYRSAAALSDHLRGGAPRVLVRSLPEDEIDRIVIPGINEDSVDPADRLISAGSATTTALCLLLDTLAKEFVIECGSLTTVHAYTSDQALQDYAGGDYRRSRSAARNIIPNVHDAGHWLGHVLPSFAGKIQTSTLNVPVQVGSLLDVSLVMDDPGVSAEDINRVMRAGAAAQPERIGVVEDPIVSSDVVGSELSLLFDAQGTMRAGEHFIKTLSWYENRGHAKRMLEVARLYGGLGDVEEVA